MNELSIFDLLPEDEANKYKPLKSTDWKWTFSDYPKEKNGLMSVPPIMIKRIVQRLIESGCFDGGKRQAKG